MNDLFALLWIINFFYRSFEAIFSFSAKLSLFAVQENYSVGFFIAGYGEK